jgi:hypothetical protein
MDTAVSSKTGRRRGATKESAMRDSARLKSGHLTGRAWEAHIPCGSLTEEQRSRRPVFDETHRAEVFLALRFVAPRSQIRSDMLPRRSAPKAKNPLSGGVQSFLSGC